jgi:hypothetical protein
MISNECNILVTFFKIFFSKRVRAGSLLRDMQYDVLEVLWREEPSETLII